MPLITYYIDENLTKTSRIFLLKILNFFTFL